MSLILAALLGALVAGLPFYLYAAGMERAASRADLRAAQSADRADELYRLLEAKAAPTEFGAYIASPQAVEAGPGFIWDDTGLIAVPVTLDD